MDSYTIDVTRLRAAIRLVMRGFGSSDAEVEAVTGNLIEANLTGHDSHGIGMLPRYVDAYQQRGLVPNQHCGPYSIRHVAAARRRRGLWPGHRPGSDGAGIARALQNGAASSHSAIRII